MTIRPGGGQAGADVPPPPPLPAFPLPGGVGTAVGVPAPSGGGGTTVGPGEGGDGVAAGVGVSVGPLGGGGFWATIAGAMVMVSSRARMSAVANLVRFVRNMCSSSFSDKARPTQEII